MLESPAFRQVLDHLNVVAAGIIDPEVDVLAPGNRTLGAAEAMLRQVGADRGGILHMEGDLIEPIVFSD